MSSEERIVGKGVNLHAAIADGWRRARDRNLLDRARDGTVERPGEDNPDVWFKVVGMWVGGYNPITQYRVQLDFSSDTPDDPGL